MPRSHRVPVADGVHLHVAEYGSPGAPAVVFGHSLLCDGTMFEHLAGDLARDHHVLDVDLRGHGESDPSPGPYAMEDQARDLLRVLDAFDVPAAVFAGVSMGSMAALRIAAVLAPERVRALVLVDTSGRAERPVNRLKYTALSLLLEAIGFHPLLLREGAKALFGRTARRDRPDLVRAWEERISRLDRRGVARAVRMVAGRSDVSSLLGRISVPTLVLCGEEDTATPPAESRRLAAAIPGAVLELLPRTGHLATVESPVETTRLVRSFLDSLR